LENYRLLQERQPEIGGALSCQQVLTFLLDFPRYSGYSIQARWANVQANDVKFPQDLTHQKSLKSVNF